MTVHFDLRLHGMKEESRLQQFIEEHVRHLYYLDAQISDCQIMISGSESRNDGSGRYEVEVRVTLPSDRLAATYMPQRDARDTTIQFAVNDAFKQMRRQLGNEIQLITDNPQVHQ